MITKKKFGNFLNQYNIKHVKKKLFVEVNWMMI